MLIAIAKGNKLLCIQLAQSGRARLRRERSVERCPPHNHVEKILVQIKRATAYLYYIIAKGTLEKSLTH
ncbi:MAG: hypothetical protein ACYT04_96440, partial [Nostoc sp.]